MDWTNIYENYSGIYLPSIKDYYLFNIRCGTLFLGLDVDSLIIWDVDIVSLAIPEVSEKGFLNLEESDLDY